MSVWPGHQGLAWCEGWQGANLGLQEEVAMGRLPITPSTAHCLHIALEAWGHPQVQHGSHICPVQSHAKGHSGHHHSQMALYEGPLHSLPLSAAHAGMISCSHSVWGMTLGKMERWLHTGWPWGLPCSALLLETGS